MADLLTDAVVTRLLANVNLAAKVSDRIVPSHISHIRDPIYPLLTLAMLTPGAKLTKAPVAHFQLLLVAYSTTSFANARDILDLAIQDLNDTVVKGVMTHWALEQTTTPIDDVDPDPTKTYFSGVIFQVRQIG